MGYVSLPEGTMLSFNLNCVSLVSVQRVADDSRVHQKKVPKPHLEMKTILPFGVPLTKRSAARRSQESNPSILAF